MACLCLDIFRSVGVVQKSKLALQNLLLLGFVSYTADLLVVVLDSTKPRAEKKEGGKSVQKVRGIIHLPTYCSTVSYRGTYC